MQDKKVVLALSGGMDSTTVLAWLIENGYSPHVVTFYYGSKHNPYELDCADKIINHYKVSRNHFDLSYIFRTFTSDLLCHGGDIPEGHYTDETMSATVVPGRNIIFLSILAGLAWSVEASHIAIGIHQGDHAIYADCRESFFMAMDTAIQQGTDGKVTIMAPFISGDKESILRWGYEHEVPYHLTRTCYKDQPIACSKCGSCRERLEAFEKIGRKDPVNYE